MELIKEIKNEYVQKLVICNKLKELMRGFSRVDDTVHEAEKDAKLEWVVLVDMIGVVKSKNFVDRCLFKAMKNAERYGITVDMIHFQGYNSMGQFTSLASLN